MNDDAVRDAVRRGYNASPGLAVDLVVESIMQHLPSFEVRPPADVRAALDLLNTLNEAGRIRYDDYVELHDLIADFSEHADTEIQEELADVLSQAFGYGPLSKWGESSHTQHMRRRAGEIMAKFEVRRGS